MTDTITQLPMTEDQFQRSVAKELDYKDLLWCHVPNGGKRDKITAAILKAQGAKSGVPDVMIFNRPPNLPDCVGAAIELKVGKNRCSKEQHAWLQGLQSLGWYTMTVWTLEDWAHAMAETGY